MMRPVMEDYVHLFEAGEEDEARTLVLLHGTGGDERDMLGLGCAVWPGAAMLSLRGDVSEGGALRFFRRRAEGVYDMADLARATAKLDAFLVRALAEHGRDPAKAVGIGYSNGANALASLMFRAPRRLGGWALLHPLIPFEPEIAPEMAGAPVLVTAGERDPIGPAPLTRALTERLRNAGAAVMEHWHAGEHELRDSEVTALTEWLEGL